MKICFICNEYPPVPHGGVGTFTQVAARALVGIGHDVRVIGHYNPRLQVNRFEEDQGVKVWRHPMKQSPPKLRWILDRYQNYAQVGSWAASGEVDIVDTADHQGEYALWPRSLRVPLISRAGGAYSYFRSEMGMKPGWLVYQLEKQSYRRTDFWIAKSDYVGRRTRELFQIPTPPDAVLYNPVDLPGQVTDFDARSPSQVIFTGTLAAKKGVIELTRAWVRVRTLHPRAELHFFGKDHIAPSGGSMIAYLQSLLPESLRASVTFHGHVLRTQVQAALASARVAVFPSYAEGFAWAPLESMAYGCPTVYSSVGSGPELIRDGKDGLLIDPRSPEAIANALCSVLEDPRFASELGEAGRRTIRERFSLERLLPKNVEFYSKCLEQRKA